jgi:peptidyl-prolyl cis-trans isomerase D
MLQTIRDKLTGGVALVVLGLIGLTLVVSFGNMSTDVASGNVAATVNGEEISMLRFRDVYQRQLNQQQEAFQGELPAVLQQQIQRNVLDGLILNRVQAQYVAGRGYRADDQRLADFIRSQEAFQVDGDFSQQSYIALLASQGVSPEQFEAEQRSFLEINELQGGIVATDFFTPAEYRRFIQLDREQRDAVFVRFDPFALLADIEVDEAEILAFYEANSQRFQTEENVDLEFVEVQLADIASTVEVDETEVRAFYEASLDRFQTAEERRARHILISVNADRDDAGAAALAGELADRLAAGEEFAALAAEYSDDPGSAKDGGELGWSGRGVYVPEFEEALFALDVGQVSAPVKTQFGYHLIELEELRSGSLQPFEEVQADLTQELQQQGAEDGFYELAEQLDDLALENPGSLEPAAQGTGLPLQRAEGFTRAGGAPFGFNQDLVEAVFSEGVLEDGENSALIEVTPGRAVVVRVAEYRRPEVRPLDDVRAEIEQELRLQAASRSAREQGEALLDRVRAGDALEALAAESGIDVLRPGPQLRRSDAVGPAVLAEVFRTVPDGGLPTFGGIADGDGGFTVFRLDNVLPGRPEALPRAQRDQAKAVLAQQTGNAALGALVLDLRAEAEVAVSPDTITAENGL